jgi:2-haloacid dehalogenase
MSTATTGSAAWTGIRTLVFDVLCTVVDEAGSLAAETTAALATAGVGPDRARRLSGAWAARLEALIAEVSAGEAPWRSNDELRRVALLDAAQDGDLDELDPSILDDLALAGHRLRPWPDSARAMQSLASAFTVVALSNADLAQLTDMSAAGGLTWHCVLSGELVRGYKPDPAVYELALELLGLDPEQTMMVAAHPWDLRAAARHGLRSAYVSRPGEGVAAPDDRFDVYTKGLADLAGLLTGGAVAGAV